MNREQWIQWGVASSGVAPVSARKLRDRFGGWEAAAREIESLENVRPRLRQAFQRAERLGRQVHADCRRLGIAILSRGDADWPSAVESLSDPPEILFVRGSLPQLAEPTVAIVGTRECTESGARWTRSVAERLSEEGWSVGSGLARGIDTAAHCGALRGVGSTLAVLGCGPDVAYPKENRALMEQIAREGVIVSEFPPGTEPRAHHFPRRNRILAALAQGTLVVECRQRSGAMVTARHALDLGREIFVVPGWPGSPVSDGPLALLRDGARPVRNATDLLQDLGGIPGGPRPSPEEVALLAVLRQGDSEPGELPDALGIPAEEARERLARLELLGLVGPGGARG